MAVATEKPKRFKGRRAKLDVRGVKRQTNGDWSVRARAQIDVRLADGRRVVADRDVHIRARQIGRKCG